MIVNLGLLIVVGLMAACGVYLLLERSLIRMLLGLLLVGNSINLMLITITGAMGNPPVLYETSAQRPRDADALAQGLVLTAIVITMGLAAFILALVYRSFVINTDDDVDDDPEDAKVLRQSMADAPDRDRSDDPLTGLDTQSGDAFDDDGNPIDPTESVGRVDIVTRESPEDAGNDGMPDEPDEPTDPGGSR